NAGEIRHAKTHVDDVHPVFQAPFNGQHDVGDVGGPFPVERIDRMDLRAGRDAADAAPRSGARGDRAGDVGAVSVVVVGGQPVVEDVDALPQGVADVRVAEIGAGVDDADFYPAAAGLVPQFRGPDVGHAPRNL